VSGFNVVSTEVERLFSSHQDSRICAIWCADDKGGEAGKNVCVLRANAEKPDVKESKSLLAKSFKRA